MESDSFVTIKAGISNSLSTVLKRQIEATLRKPNNDQQDETTEMSNLFNESVIKMYNLFEIVFTDELASKNKNKCPWNQLCCVLDVSGSTGNFSDNCGRGSRFSSSRFSGSRFENDDDNENKTENEPIPVITKPIILAEIECMMHSLLRLMRRFDMTGTKLVLIPFSSSFCVFEYVIQSNENLCKLINEQFRNIPYECGSTNLVEPLEFLEKHYFSSNIKNLLILATDGQPSNKEKVLSIINNNCKMFDLIVIGAGSIGANACNDIYFRGRRTSIINPESLETLVELGALSIKSKNFITNIGDRNRLASTTQINSYSECDIEYLKRFDGLYVGAYKDYADAINDIDGFLDIMNENRQMTKNFNLMLDGKKILLNSYTQDALSSGQYVIILAPNKVHYLITQQWQIAINNPFGNNLIDACTISEIKSHIINLTKLKFDDMWKLKISDQESEITLIKANQDELITKICLDNDGYVKVRPIHYM